MYTSKVSIQCSAHFSGRVSILNHAASFLSKPCHVTFHAKSKFTCEDFDMFIQQPVHTVEAEANVKLCFLYKHIRPFVHLKKSACPIQSGVQFHTHTNTFHLDKHPHLPWQTHAGQTAILSRIRDLFMVHLSVSIFIFSFQNIKMKIAMLNSIF